MEWGAERYTKRYAGTLLVTIGCRNDFVVSNTIAAREGVFHPRNLLGRKERPTRLRQVRYGHRVFTEAERDIMAATTPKVRSFSEAAREAGLPVVVDRDFISELGPVIWVSARPA